MSKRILTVPLTCAAVVALASAEDLAERVLLRYKWNAGDQVTWTANVELEGDLVMTDLTKQPPGEQAMHLVRTARVPLDEFVEAVDEEGTGTVAYTLGLIEIDQTTGDQAPQHIVIDPAAKTMTVNGETVPLPEAALGHITPQFRMVMSPLGEVLKFDAPFAQEQLFDMPGISGTDFLRVTQASQMEVPEDPVQEGYTWAQTVQLRPTPPPEQQEDAEDTDEEPPSLSLTMVYTLIGFEVVEQVECAKMEMVGAMDIREPYRVSTSTEGTDLTVETGPGHFSIHGFAYLDPEAGCLLKTELETIMILQQATRGQVQAGNEIRDINTIIAMDRLVQRTTLVREPQD
jgi:hypothetical protein